MATKKWSKEYKYELTKMEKAFDDLLRENNFNILGIRSYQRRMEWKIEKDGIEFMYVIDCNCKDIQITWKNFILRYNTEKKLSKLLKKD